MASSIEFDYHAITTSGLRMEKRNYLIDVPPSANPRREFHPKVAFLFHGFTSNASVIVSAFQQLKAFGYVLIAPNGYEKSWSANVCCGKALQEKRNDAHFFKALLKHVKAQLSFEKYVFIGSSNGGYFSSLVGLLASNCDADLNELSGIVLLAGYQYDKNLYFPPQTQCSKDGLLLPRYKRVDLLQIHGGNDQTVKQDGCCQTSNCCCGISDSFPSCVSARQSFEWWKQKYHCALEDLILPGRNAEYDSKQTQIIAKACDEGTKLVYLSIDTAPHNLFKVKNDMIHQFFLSKNEEAAATTTTTGLGGVYDQNNNTNVFFLLLFMVLIIIAWVICNCFRWRGRLPFKTNIEKTWRR